MDKTSFVKLWLNDPTRRTVNEIDMKPSDDPLVFSHPVVFHFKSFEPVQDPKAVELFQELLQVVCGRHQETYTYVLSWFAHLLQRPFENPKTAIFLTGKKGCGKDTIGDFVIDWLVGTIYAHNYDSTAQFWDKHDGSRENRFFIKIEEVQGAMSRKYDSEFKSRITSENLTVNPKGDKSRSTKNYNRIFGTTNEPQPYKTEGDDERRGFTVPCSPEWCQNHEKWTEIRSTLFCASGASSVGQWLLAHNIDSWDSRKIPKTDYMKFSAEAEIVSEKSFLEQWDGESCSMKDLYPKYTQYCQQNDMPYAINSKSFGIRLLEYIRDGVLKKTRANTGMEYSK
jgi:phage/plasmid-associated DNA primase